MENNNQVAKTIYQQIGGNRFMAMVGGKDIFYIDNGNGLRFSFGRNKTSANRCEIVYNAGLDLYTMRFIRHTFSRRTFENKQTVMKEYTDVYCDQLESLFSDFTGMATYL